MVSNIKTLPRAHEITISQKNYFFVTTFENNKITTSMYDSTRAPLISKAQTAISIAISVFDFLSPTAPLEIKSFMHHMAICLVEAELASDIESAMQVLESNSNISSSNLDGSYAAHPVFD